MRHFILIPTLLLILLSQRWRAPVIAEEIAAYPPRYNAVVRVVRETGGAVVNISTEKTTTLYRDPFYQFSRDFFRDFFTPPARQYKQESLGSGVLISRDGYVVTNEHVILPASRITISLIDQREFEARLIGSSARFDLAVLEIDTDDPLPAIHLGRSDDLMIGETVIAIGNPYGLQHTVTTGVISALDRTLKIDEDNVFHNLIQTDTSINPGNSGGPLLNIRSELIGINTAIYQQAQGIGFAIPVNKMKRVVDSLIHFGEVQSAWIGIVTQDLNPNLAQSFQLKDTSGILIRGVMKDSPAAEAGVRSSDILLAIDDYKLDSTQQYRDLISDYPAGSRLQLRLLRDGATHLVSVTSRAIRESEIESLLWNRYGMKVEQLTRPLAKRLGRHYEGELLVVTELRQHGKAARVGLRIGDAVIRLNNREVTELKPFLALAYAAMETENLLLIIGRGANYYYVSL